MASFVYDSHRQYQFDGTAVVDFDTDALYVSLHTATYTPDQGAHDFFNDVTNEVSVSGYTSGGQSMTSKTITKDTANHRVDIDAADIVWSIPSGSTLTARYAVIYKRVGTTNSASPIVALIDFGSDQTASNGTFTIQWSTPGFLRIA